MQAIADRVDLLVINRFGRAESLGRGLRSCFERAIEADVPVLTAVRIPYDEAWRNFHDGIGLQLTCDVEPVTAWVANLAPPVPGRLHPLSASTLNPE